MAVEDIFFGSWLEFEDDGGCRLVEIGVPEPSDGVTIGVKNDFFVFGYDCVVFVESSDASIVT